MANSVLVIIGAGASHDLLPHDFANSRNIGWSNVDLLPPLTKDVFRDDDHTRTILARYQGARNLAATIRLELARGKQLEPLLKDYSESTSQPLTKQFTEIPLYLQDFFSEISNFTDQPTNYQHLAHSLFAREPPLGRIVFLTLNYETLLDDVLFPDYVGVPSNDMSAYVSERCMLVKLHGSVNWARSFEMSLSLSFGLTNYLSMVRGFGYTMLKGIVEPEIVIVDPKAARWRVKESRRNDQELQLFYPSISVPLGDYNRDFACPSEHTEALKSALGGCRNVLAIGTSARDNDVLDLLKEGLPHYAEFLHVVDAGDQATEDTATRLRVVPQLQRCHTELHPQGFSGFILSDALGRFIEQCKGSEES